MVWFSFISITICIVQSKDYRRRHRNFNRRQQQTFEHSHRQFDNWNQNSKEKDEGFGIGSGEENHVNRDTAKLGSEFKRYVSFYFTNFLYQLSNFYLRKGFEVCGMLEDVFVPKKRNKCGQPFGLVKFSNVRDITKLLRALNNVYFGHYCVRARVASFDRNDVTASQRMETERLGLTKGNVKPAIKECIDTDPRTVNLNGNDIRIKSMGPQAKKGVGRDAGPVKGGSGDPGAVRVGDIDVSLGARKEKVTRHNDQGDPEVRHHIDTMVENFAKGMEEDDEIRSL
ncbi:unnamed protein product [Trifolium pratense]|uniref:Uncharacterized protein n=1 Tax=Trifolium pratense TaxID=57577 RepID=A0ACB0KWY6_TRIPR|nr:unnamed protein product [Trifolium pratense]